MMENEPTSRSTLPVWRDQLLSVPCLLSTIQNEGGVREGGGGDGGGGGRG